MVKAIIISVRVMGSTSVDGYWFGWFYVIKEVCQTGSKKQDGRVWVGAGFQLRLVIWIVYGCQHGWLFQFGQEFGIMHFDLLSATVLIVFLCGCVFSFFYFKRHCALCSASLDKMKCGLLSVDQWICFYLLICIFSYYFQFSLSIMPFFSFVCFFL